MWHVCTENQPWSKKKLNLCWKWFCQGWLINCLIFWMDSLRPSAKEPLLEYGLHCFPTASFELRSFLPLLHLSDCLLTDWGPTLLLWPLPRILSPFPRIHFKCYKSSNGRGRSFLPFVEVTDLNLRTSSQSRLWVHCSVARRWMCQYVNPKFLENVLLWGRCQSRW